MNNAAVICRIKNVRPHFNADKVKLGTACGYQVVVGLDVNEGDLGIYFPTDTCLGKDFAEANPDLLTYFGKNMRVKTQKFRGEKSEGFWVTVETLSFCSLPYEFDEGDEITELSRLDICHKFVNPRTLAAKNRDQSKIARVLRSGSLPTFQKHVETSHLRKEWDRIVATMSDRQWIWTFKQHGTCLTSNARVRMADGAIKKIKDIKIGDIVASKDGPAKVLDTMVYPATYKWVSFFTKVAGKASRLICTKEHLLFTNLGWVEAQNITPAHQLAVSKYQLRPTQIQRDFHEGKLWGDGYFNKHLSLEYAHKEDHKEYVDYCRNGFGNLTKSFDERTSGYGTKMIRTLNKVSRFLPAKASYLSPLVLAVWYMDDGSLAHSETQQDRANLAICRYPDDQIPFMLEAFQTLGLTPKYYKDASGYNRLRFNLLEANKLFEMIKTFIPPIMQYKLPATYRGYFVPIEYQVAQEDLCTWFTQDYEIGGHFSFGGKADRRRFDIQTTTGSFIANNIVVHNSARVGHVLVPRDISVATEFTKNFGSKIKVLARKIKQKNFGDKISGELVDRGQRIDSWLLKQYKKLPLVQSSYQYLIGTRNVILGEAKQDTWYPEKLRQKAALPFIGNLHKGEVIYYEIVGYAAPCVPIMAKHTTDDKELKKLYSKEIVYTYGCKDGEFDIYVYRIAYQTEDGESIDLSWDQVKTRCKELGVKHVVEIPGFWGTYHLDKLLDYVTDFVDRPDPIDPSHPLEGVVLRVEGSKPEFFKEKSFTFKVLEGLAVDKGEIDLEEAS